MSGSTTRPTLLSRVRDPADRAAWDEFDAHYRDLILGYCRARGLQLFDAEDVRQLVMMNLAAALRGFQYDPRRGRFRDYLGRVTRGAIQRVVARPKPDGRALSIEQDYVEPAAGDDDAALWEQEWAAHHYRLAMRAVRASFEPRSVAAFESLVAGASVAESARAHGLSEQALHKIKQRIRDRLRELIARQVREEDGDGGA